MPLVNTKKMLKDARDGRYAVGHFNASNLEFAQAIIETADALNSPVIIGTSVSALEFATAPELFAIVKTLAAKTKVPVALHLDHGPSVDWAKACLKNGWTSLMIDTSKYDTKTNIFLTKQVVRLARPKNVSVEAEIGRLKGIEDIVNVSERDATLTDPKEAKAFVKATGCDSLAVAIGESHGAFKFKGKPKLDIPRLREIRNQVSVPLVLHGASSVYPDWVAKANRFGAKIANARGVPDSIIKKCVKNGVCKVNTDTDLRLAFTASVREFLAKNPKSIDYREMLAAGRKGVADIVKKKILVFGSKGKA